MSIHNATDFNQLQTCLNGANIKGSSIFDSSGEKIGQVSDLQTKLKQLYQSQIVDNPDVKKGREAAYDLCCLIFEAEQLPRQDSLLNQIAARVFGHPLEEVKSTCLAHMRKDPTVMQRVVEQYNTLAKNWNSGVHYHHDDPTISESHELKQLHYLNGFLGLPWSNKQNSGHEALPLFGELEELIVDDKSEIHKPSQCETILELHSLMVRTATSPIIVEHGGKFPSAMIEQIEDRLEVLYKKERGLDNFSSGSRALETMATIFELDSHRPEGNHRPEKFDKIWKECQIPFSKDTDLSLKVHRAYNKGIEQPNFSFIASCGVSGSIHSRHDAKLIAFYGAVLGLEVPPTKVSKYKDYEEMTNIFPETYVSLSQEELETLEIDFSFCSLLLNQQTDLVRKRDKLQTIEKKLEFGELSSLLDDEAKKKLQAERLEISASLVGMPPSMPKNLFKALWEQQLRRMELLNIKPTVEQKRMKASLPVLGLDLPSPIKTAQDLPSIRLPFLIDWYNERVDFSNATRTKLELRSKIKERKQMVYDVASTEDWEKIKSLVYERKNAEKALEDWKSNTKRGDQVWNVPTTLEYRAKLLQLGEIFPFVKVTRDQVMGIEPWPRIDITQVPRPPVEELIFELEPLSKKDRIHYFNHWPDHWKQDLPNEIKKLIE